MGNSNCLSYRSPSIEEHPSSLDLLTLPKSHRSSSIEQHPSLPDLLTLPEQNYVRQYSLQSLIFFVVKSNFYNQ